MTLVGARIIAAVDLDRDTCRLTAVQTEMILWRGALLQLPATHFGVVAHGGVARLCKFLNLIPEPTVELQRQDTLAKVASQGIAWDAIFIPGKLQDGIPSVGIRAMTDITADHVTAIKAAAAALQNATIAPAYALQLPNVQQQRPAPNSVAPMPTGPAMPTGYGNLLAAPATSALGTQWNVSLSIGSIVVFTNTTVEMKKAGSVTVLSGPCVQRELE